jgi:hypothetical protein
MSISIPRIKKAIWCYKRCREKNLTLKISLMYASWYFDSEMVLD